MLELHSVTKVFTSVTGNSVVAVKDVSFEVRPSELVSIIGPSGCGKSTLLRLIADIIQPTEGWVRIAGLAPSQARKARHLGFVFQDPALLPWRDVLSNVTFPLEIQRANPKEAAAKAESVLEMVGLADFRRAYPHELSGGMRQRVAIARALVMEPRVLLMDEPFGALDEFTRNYLNDELLRLWEKIGVTIVFVTHSIQEALYLADRVLVMTSGPGRVVDFFKVELPRPREEGVRLTKLFTDSENELRLMLYRGAGSFTFES